ncbi:MAG: hypothetical protein ACAI34_08590 [Verrucomicrobium sp.]
MKAIFFPPLVAMLGWFAIPALVLWEWRQSEVVINGQLDDSPYHAAGFMIIFSPFAFLLFLLAHVIVFYVGRWTGKPVWSLYLVGYALLILAMVGYNTWVYSWELVGTMMMMISAVLGIFAAPVVLTTWLVERADRNFSWKGREVR